MKKNNHLQSAIKSLRKARDQYQVDHDKFEVAEQSAKRSKEMMAVEIAKLDKQIAENEQEEFVDALYSENNK